MFATIKINHQENSMLIFSAVEGKLPCHCNYKIAYFFCSLFSYLKTNSVTFHILFKFYDLPAFTSCADFIRMALNSALFMPVFALLLLLSVVSGLRCRGEVADLAEVAGVICNGR